MNKCFKNPLIFVYSFIYLFIFIVIIFPVQLKHNYSDIIYHILKVLSIKMIKRKCTVCYQQGSECLSFYKLCLFVLRFYGSVKLCGHVERGQFA